MTMTSQTQLQLSVDLIGQTISHIGFLKAVDGHPYLRNKDVLKRAIYRYEKYWLPLAAEHPHEYLSAPMDIEWVWHCHMLSPKHYEEDCYKIVGRTVNHTIRRPEEFQVTRNNAHAYWTKKYQSAFYVDQNEDAPVADFDVEEYNSVITYDIISAAERQTVFYYQVSLPHYQDLIYLEQAVKRYKQFLLLKRKYPNELLVPCYDIDIIWHTHQLNPIQYKQDTVRITGQLFNHNDSVNERHEGSELDVADKKTRELWKDTFADSYARFGAMYRGKPSKGILYDITQREALMCCTQQCSISLDLIFLSLPTPDLNRNKNLTLKVSSSSATRKKISDWFKLKRPSSVPSGCTSITWTNVGSFGVNTLCEHGILFSLQQKEGFRKPKSEIGANFMNLIPQIISTGPQGKPLSEQLKIVNNATLTVKGHINPPHIADAILKLSSSTPYETREIPDDIHSLLGPISLERLPSNNDKHTCLEATHTITNHLGFEVFKVRTFHSTSLMTSVIHVCYREKLAAIAHVISADQIPLPTQVHGNKFCLNPKQGERAVLIKNNNGDWGIVFGSWHGLVRGVPPNVKQEQQQIGSHGTLRLRFYKASTGEMHNEELGYNRPPQHNPYVFSAESCHVDLETGKIQIDPSSHELAENIAYIFSVALVHVLCVPRAKSWKPGITFNLPERRGNRMIVQVPSDDLKVIKAAGVLEDTPSNHFIYNNLGSKHCATCGSAEGYLPVDADWGQIPDRGFGENGFKDAYGDLDGCGCGGCVGDVGYVGGDGARFGSAR